MNDAPFRVLLRVASELTYRTNKTVRHLEEVVPPGDVANFQVRQPIENALTKLSEGITETVSQVRAQYDNNPGQSLKVLAANLTNISRWFLRIHEMLAYLPRANVAPESIGLLSASLPRYYQTIQPSVILGSLFNAAEFNFFEIVRSRLPPVEEIQLPQTENIVLQLAICDRDAPSAWPILAHELAHAIDRSEGISDTIPEDVLRLHTTGAVPDTIPRSWCREICADLIAARALGPAPILALISLEYCLLPNVWIFQPSETHPPTKWRLHIVKSYLQDEHRHDFVSQEEETYLRAWDYSVQTAFPGLKLESVRVQDRKLASQLQPLVAALIERVAELDIPDFRLIPEAIERCAKRLNQGLPIAAQGSPREGLREALARHQNTSFGSAEERISKFQEMLPKFNEDPLSPASILLSCFNKRYELIAGSLHPPGALEDAGAVSDFFRSLERLDELVINSVSTSTLHAHMLRQEGRDDSEH